ncbi:MAG: MBOAT family protein, partial [bacterium]|nr:MBOAT family protein [bacterium]
ALFVNQVYDNPTQYEGLSLVMATIYFSFQVYCDFSGYTDIAVGAGKVMGFDLMDNFNRPYFAVSIGEFWKRWHISLSSWLMDYLFLPIAYAVSRRIKKPVLLKFKAETWAYVTGIIVTMTLCGIWHGAKWTFLIWGVVHGLYMAASFATRKLRRKVRKKLKFGKKALIPNLLRVALTFGFVTFAWIFFRADSLSDAVYIINHLFTGWSKALNVQGLLASLHFGLLKKELAVAGAALAVMLLVHLLRKTDSFGEWIAQRKPVLRWSFYVVLLVWLLVFAESGSEQFIYFRF